MENRSLPLVAQLILWLALAGPVAAAEAVGTPEQEADWQQRLDKAGALQSEGKARQEVAERRYFEDEAACYRKFLVNACRNDAREIYIKERSEGRRLETEGKVIELQVKKEQVAERDRQTREAAPQRAADLQARQAEVEAQRQAAEAARAATLADKAGKAEAGARRKAEDEARLQRKQEAHAARIKAKMDEAKRKAAEDKP